MQHEIGDLVCDMNMQQLGIVIGFTPNGMTGTAEYFVEWDTGLVFSYSAKGITVMKGKLQQCMSTT